MLDVEEANENEIWNGISKALPKQKRTDQRIIWSVAATLLILIAVLATWYFNSERNNTRNLYAGMIEANPEFASRQEFYLNEIDMKWAKINCMNTAKRIPMDYTRAGTA